MKVFTFNQIIGDLVVDPEKEWSKNTLIKYEDWKEITLIAKEKILSGNIR